MTDTRDIRRSLEKRLNAGSYTGITNSTDIAWENVDFDPKAKTAWLRPKTIITERQSAIVGPNPVTRWDGLFLIDCFRKNNEGTQSLDDLTDDVLAQFEHTTLLTENSKTLIILSATPTGGYIQEPPWSFQPITISWYSYIS